MKPVNFAAEAKLELLDSASFYEARTVGLGLRFEQVMERAVQEIQAAPQRFPQQKDGTRRYVVEGFPFVIHFEELPEYVLIWAFSHAGRRPGYWRGRREP